MKNYTDSDYALNKINRNAIVYRFADEVVEVTLADFLAENPDKTEADFRALKELSDADYLEQDRDDYRRTYKNVSIHGLDETAACSACSLEEKLIEQPEREAMKERKRELGFKVFNTLTEVQRRRYIQNKVEGLSSWKIAEIEQVDHKAVLRSIWAAEKKINKFLMDA